MRLFHFSDDADIGLFEPRPVRIPVERGPGRAWLNDPLVWAIDEPHSMLYLFPRECPRILIWPTANTTGADRTAWMGETMARAVAFIETSWLDRLRAARIHRYEMPPETFESISDVGMWVSRNAIRPKRVEALVDLPDRLSEAGVELRTLDRLTPLMPVWASTLHASGIRLRNATDWKGVCRAHGTSDIG